MAALIGPRDALAQAGPDPGRTSYDKHCALCHGTAGKGDGPAADLLLPRPRDFTAGKYKIRTTPSGQLPTDDSLEPSDGPPCPHAVEELGPRLDPHRWQRLALRQADQAVRMLQPVAVLAPAVPGQTKPHPTELELGAVTLCSKVPVRLKRRHQLAGQLCPTRQVQRIDTGGELHELPAVDACT